MMNEINKNMPEFLEKNDMESKQQAINKCTRVLLLIERLRKRNIDLSNLCKNIYGQNENGYIRAKKEDLQRFNMNKQMIDRLKHYYNYCLSNLKPF